MTVTLLALLLTVSACQLCVAAVADDLILPSFIPDVPEAPLLRAASIVRQARLSTSTFTLISITTISSVTSTTITTKKTCAVLASGVTINGITTLTTTPTTTCRRRRLFWDEPVFIALQGDDNLALQFREIHPSQLIRFEPTLLPEFRANKVPIRNKAQVVSNILKQSGYTALPTRTTGSPTPEAVQSSIEVQPTFEQQFEHFRIAEPFFFTALSAAVSSIISNLITSTTTITSTISSFTSTFTSTSFSTTSSYFLAGVCYPSGLTTC